MKTLGWRGLLSSLSIALATPSLAQESAPRPLSGALRIEREVGSSQELNLEVGQNRLMESSVPLGRVSVANPDVADLKVVTNTQLLLTAKGAGDTYLTLWDKSDKPLVMSLHVTRNLDSVRRQLKELFPGEQVNVSAAGELVMLSGEVSDVRLPERIMSVVRLNAPKIANLLSVRGNQQVQLEVKFAEVQRSGLREMGVNWFHGGAKRTAGIVPPGQAVNDFATPPTRPPLPAVHPTYFSPSGSAFSMFFSTLGSFPFSAVVSLLEENALAKTLAEPTLVSMTGQEARFLAGGEFPIPLASALGQVQVDYKKFGIQLKFTPTVLGDGLLSLKLATEVSEIDPSIGVSLGGFTVPGLSTRQSETTVRLRDGQSFAVAGLLSDKTRSVIDKVPLLGELPVLGALFRSTQFRRDESELLVVITARLVRPVAPGEAPKLPGHDELNDPNDVELFLLGKQSHWKRLAPERGQAIPVRKSRDGGPSGQMGYMR